MHLSYQPQPVSIQLQSAIYHNQSPKRLFLYTLLLVMWTPYVSKLLFSLRQLHLAQVPEHHHLITPASPFSLLPPLASPLPDFQFRITVVLCISTEQCIFETATNSKPF